MPCCCVMGCHNRAEKGYKLYKLPQGANNVNRRKLWIRNIGRKNSLPQHAYVCQDHFTDDQFELGRADHKKLLKWNAVPTIFSHNKASRPRNSSKKQIINNIAESNNTLRQTVTEEQVTKTEIYENNDNNKADEIIILKKKLKDARKEINTLKTIICRLQGIIVRLADTYEMYETINDSM